VVTDLSLAITRLKQGRVIAYPTEAVYGLGCDPMCQDAVQTLVDFKRRPINKGLILVAGDFELLAPFVDVVKIPDDMWKKINQSWPGPYTWVLPKSTHCPPWVSGDFDSVAVRVSDHPIVKQLTAQFKQPIVSTSANLAGLAPALNAQQVTSMFGDSLGEIVDAPLGEQRQPSQILDAMTGKRFR